MVLRSNKKYIVGPSRIKTKQQQRYRYDTMLQKYIVSTTTTISNAPYCDYFSVEMRCVIRTSNVIHNSYIIVGTSVRYVYNNIFITYSIKG